MNYLIRVLIYVHLIDPRDNSVSREWRKKMTSSSVSLSDFVSLWDAIVVVDISIGRIVETGTSKSIIHL